MQAFMAVNIQTYIFETNDPDPEYREDKYRKEKINIKQTVARIAHFYHY